MSPALKSLLAPARRPCGGLTVRVEGETCVLRCSGALWLPAFSALVAGDLHLEKGSAFAARGQMLPPYDSAATLAKLAAEVAELQPQTVVLLGDSFHDSKALARLAPDDIAAIEALAAGRDWVWLEGNHDRVALGDAFEHLPGRVVETMQLGRLHLIHEPQPGPQAGEVAGHLHPCAKVAAYGRGVRASCFVTDGRRLILPAFGAFTGGLNVRDPAIADLFAERPMAAALGRDKIHAISWERLL